jgi:toxin YoeB
MKLRVVFSPRAWDQFTDWLSADPKTAKKIVRLIKDIQRDPDGPGIGKPELLLHAFAGFASRRIDNEHRLIYRIRDDDLEVVQCRGHYNS